VLPVVEQPGAGERERRAADRRDGGPGLDAAACEVEDLLVPLAPRLAAGQHEQGDVLGLDRVERGVEQEAQAARGGDLRRPGGPGGDEAVAVVAHLGGDREALRDVGVLPVGHRVEAVQHHGRHLVLLG
jgi:hypothetical protein